MFDEKEYSAAITFMTELIFKPGSYCSIILYGRVYIIYSKYASKQTKIIATTFSSLIYVFNVYSIFI